MYSPLNAGSFPVPTSLYRRALPPRVLCLNRDDQVGFDCLDWALDSKSIFNGRGAQQQSIMDRFPKNYQICGWGRENSRSSCILHLPCFIIFKNLICFKKIQTPWSGSALFSFTQSWWCFFSGPCESIAQPVTFVLRIFTQVVLFITNN